MTRKIQPLTRFIQLICSGAALISASSYATTTNQPAPPGTQQVFFVGNNWDGTVTVIKPSGNFEKIGVINMIPDRKERLLEIHLNPIKLIAYTYIQATAGVGNDQLVDDMYSTVNGILKLPPFYLTNGKVKLTPLISY